MLKEIRTYACLQLQKQTSISIIYICEVLHASLFLPNEQKVKKKANLVGQHKTVISL